MSSVSYNHTRLRDFADVLRRQDVIIHAGIEVLWGAQARDFQPSVPTVCIVPTEDRFEKCGDVRHAHTALPENIGPATKGRPNVEVTTQTLWTRYAGCSLVLFAVEPTDIETLIWIVMTALRDTLGAAGNWTDPSGRHDPRGGFSDLSDTYVLSTELKLPIYRMQRRYTAEATEQEVIPDGPQ